MFLQTTPDTTAYMIAGYILFFVVFTAYTISLASRRKKLERELQALEELDE